MVDLLTIGASASQLYKSALTTVGNNIANLHTDGYSRQSVETSENIPNQLGTSFIGTGASLDGVIRSFSNFTENNLRQSNSELSTQSQLITYADRIVDIMGSESAGLSGALDKFFMAAGDLSIDPASGILRDTFLTESGSVAVRFNELAGQLSDIEQQTQSEINLNVQNLNNLTQQLQSINQQLDKNILLKNQPPMLLDSRDKVLLELADIAKIHVSERASGAVDVRLDSSVGSIVVDGNAANRFSTVFDPTQPGKVEIVAAYGSGRASSSVTGGALGGLLNFRSQVLAPAIDSFDDLASTFATEVNAIQTTGVDLNGDRGTALFTIDAALGGAAGISLLQTDSNKIAAAGLLRVTPNSTNQGDMTLEIESTAAGATSGPFTLTYTTASGYTIAGDPYTPTADGTITYAGVTLSLSGTPGNGDSLAVVLNADSAGDNRNMLLMTRLQTKDVVSGGGSINQGYTDIVTTIGSQATLAKMSREALQVIYDQSVAAKDRISGVNLDEEAADLIKFQQAFQASAQIIQVSQKLFDSILAVR
ncbi:MAG: Flagellar hook-associated protein 1 [Porticoccaceae bacterium UBA1117]|nr:flagellar hook-associated protein FlgK [Porticoccaceae bacterium]CAI8387739.1 MAG: Flagellar hook-associated protein 1 [Porticoccaceae bacterium UBA1117]|tara:strand:- start:3462 stop:5072 length:1611 start_codon:yes stop_codon:yes gene_type:complete